jgi:uncharacterized protein YciI
MELEAFELVPLLRPEQLTLADEATIEEIQVNHLAFYERLRSEGVVVTNGPVLDQPDETLRGLAVLPNWIASNGHGRSPKAIRRCWQAGSSSRSRPGGARPE